MQEGSEFGKWLAIASKQELIQIHGLSKDRFVGLCLAYPPDPGATYHIVDLTMKLAQAIGYAGLQGDLSTFPGILIQEVINAAADEL